MPPKIESHSGLPLNFLNDLMIESCWDSAAYLRNENTLFDMQGPISFALISGRRKNAEVRKIDPDVPWGPAVPRFEPDAGASLSHCESNSLHPLDS